MYYSLKQCFPAFDARTICGRSVDVFFKCCFSFGRHQIVFFFFFFSVIFIMMYIFFVFTKFFIYFTSTENNFWEHFKNNQAFFEQRRACVICYENGQNTQPKIT
jgi:hypothetical protein